MTYLCLTILLSFLSNNMKVPLSQLYMHFYCFYNLYIMAINTLPQYVSYWLCECISIFHISYQSQNELETWSLFIPKQFSVCLGKGQSPILVQPCCVPHLSYSCGRLMIWRDVVYWDGEDVSAVTEKLGACTHLASFPPFVFRCLNYSINPFWKLPYRHAQKCVSWQISVSAKLTIKIIYYSPDTIFVAIPSSSQI